VIALLLSLAFAEDMDLSVLDQAVGVEPFDAPETDEAIIAERTQAIADGLRCPVCQGMSVGASATDAAVAMKARIEELVRAGYTDDQIVDYFAERYGTWILLAPPKEDNALVWLGPAAVAGLGLAGVIGFAVVAGRRREEAPAPDVPQDAYTERVLKELDE